MTDKPFAVATRHGTTSTYTNYGCRCDDCRVAWSAYMRTASKRRHERGLEPGDPRHGKASSYSNYRCRCGACRDAWAAYQRSRRAS